jgi:Ran GTPase-activating protein (RanGAP) involved in mRNA processing and transport
MYSLEDFFATNQVLKELILVECDLGNMGMKVLSRGIRDNCTLKTLDLTRNEIQDEGIIYFAEALENGKTKLHSLNFSRNRISDSGAKKLAHALRYFQNKRRTLEILDLSDNMIGADGAFFLGEQLRFNA